MSSEDWGDSAMNKKIASSLILSCSILASADLAHSAVLSSEFAGNQAVLTQAEGKNSLIAQAADKNIAYENYDVALMNTLKTPASQNFFAKQNQRFTRFIQSF